MRRVLIGLAALMIVALLPAAAHATTCVGPPGLGAVDQYCELVPASGGHTGSGTSSKKKTIPATTRTQLQQAGRDGQGVLALAQTTPAAATRKKPKTSTRQSRSTRSTTTPTRSTTTPTRSTARTPSVPSSGTLDVVHSALLDGPTVSLLLPWALLALTLAGGALAFRRRRSD
jgi:hypothetical protein